MAKTVYAGPFRSYQYDVLPRINATQDNIGRLVPLPCWPELGVGKTPFTCFKMAAPLDHTNTSDPRQASIAVIKYPAGGGNTPSSQIRGTVFLNPGGPGGSGVGFLITRHFAAGYNVTVGEMFDTIFLGNYDIMSFDPRAVGYTYPSARCYADGEAFFMATDFSDGAGLPHSSNASSVATLAWDDLNAQVCKQRLGEVLKHVTTASTAKDLNLLRQAVGDEQLNLVGLSYGTVLGSYFADIFPGRVGKFWLDGVFDVPNYQAGRWSDNIADFEAVLQAFFTTCAEGPSGACALASRLTAAQKATSDKGAGTLRTLVLSLLDSLRERPVAVANASVPSIFAYIHFKYAMLGAAYMPSQWPQLASEINEALNGNWVPLTENWGVTLYNRTSDNSPSAFNYLSVPSISCSDSLTHDLKWGRQEFEAAVQAMERLSPFAAEMWIRNGAVCLSGWRIRGADVWKGGFNSTPSEPIVFASTTYDPVTPLFAARKMRDRFGGPNRLVHLKGAYGHSTFSAATNCSLSALADWFVYDRLPPEKEIICEAEVRPFGQAGRNLADARLQAIHGVAETVADQLLRAQRRR
ncbi:unnamed protein product [Parajaminaea phylloscopi]